MGAGRGLHYAYSLHRVLGYGPDYVLEPEHQDVPLLLLHSRHFHGWFGPQPPPILPPDSLPLVLGKVGRNGQRLGKTRFHTAPFAHLTRLFRANWTTKGGHPRRIGTTGDTAGTMTRTGLLLGKAPRGGIERLGSWGLCMVGKSGAGVLRTSPPAEGSAKGGANTLWGFVNGGTPRSHRLIHIVATTGFSLWRHRKTRTLHLL